VKARGRVSVPALWREEWTRPRPHSDVDDPETFFRRAQARQSDEGLAWGRWRYALRVLMRWRKLGRPGAVFHRQLAYVRSELAPAMRSHLVAGEWVRAVSVGYQVEIVVLRMRLELVQPVANGNPQISSAQQRRDFLDVVGALLVRSRNAGHDMTLDEALRVSAFLRFPFDVSERQALAWLTDGDAPLFQRRAPGRPRKNST
jgi:hypothetical protein